MTIYGGKTMKLSEFKEKLMQDPEFKAEYESGEFEYQVKRAIIAARINQNLTQKELAERAGTNQSNISKFETGSYVPTYDFLYKIVRALGKELKISIV